MKNNCTKINENADPDRALQQYLRPFAKIMGLGQKSRHQWRKMGFYLVLGFLFVCLRYRMFTS